MRCSIANHWNFKRDCGLNSLVKNFITVKLTEIQQKPFIYTQALILQYNFSNNFCNSLCLSLMTSFKSVTEASLLVGYLINMSLKDS